MGGGGSFLSPPTDARLNEAEKASARKDEMIIICRLPLVQLSYRLDCYHLPPQKPFVKRQMHVYHTATGIL